MKLIVFKFTDITTSVVRLTSDIFQHISLPIVSKTHFPSSIKISGFSIGCNLSVLFTGVALFVKIDILVIAINFVYIIVILNNVFKLIKY